MPGEKKGDKQERGELRTRAPGGVKNGDKAELSDVTGPTSL
jgi:hypothetical protein